MNKINIAKKKPLVNKVVFLNGISRAGKFFLGKIVSAFENIEYFQYVSVLENIPYLEQLGCISENVAIPLLQIGMDEYAYHMYIGRNLNFRIDDASSLSNSLETDRYIKRSLTPVGKEIAEKIRREGRSCLFILHESLPNIDIFFKAFPQLKWINLIRHPIDIIHSWYSRGWGHRFASDLLSFAPAMKGKKCSVPWYASEWKKEYEAMSDVDRIIKGIAVVFEKGEAAYLSLTEKQKKQILFISYENVVEKTDKVIKEIGFFLNTVPLPGMPIVLTKEKCPNKIPIEQRKCKMENIRNVASKEMFKLMMDLTSSYEKKD